MSTRVIPAREWRDALDLLVNGEIVAIPTDTVYGIAAMPLDVNAIDAIYAAKDRPVDKALPMLVATVSAAERIADLSGPVHLLCDRFWPGPLTVVASSAATFSSPATADDGTVALRMPALDLALLLIGATGGVLAVTSANRSGHPAATTAAGVLAQLDGRIAAVVDGGPSPGGSPSSVVRIMNGQLQLLRGGGISQSELERALYTGP
ncbi:MAG TPA: L-threonylcarbamoyladenylate synthase [Dehalococcoidia bacterium]|nr:L-threonylcarbamoyladenylate synthase [Dehalococcoidia bacterium]